VRGVDTRGEVACAAAANVFWIEDGVVCTPALDCGVLDGIMRARVLAACAALGVATAELRATPDRLAGRGLFLTNSLIGLRRVATLDGRGLPDAPEISAIAERAGA